MLIRQNFSHDCQRNRLSAVSAVLFQAGSGQHRETGPSHLNADASQRRIQITMDSWFVSEDLKKRLRELGFSKIVIAGKGNYTFKIGETKQKASSWKKTLRLIADQWGIDVPSLRTEAFSPTFGRTVLFFFQKSATRT